MIGRTQANIPGLPSKEEADYERDQALYAHYRQAYERDWYERGIMPPAPYDRFVHARFSRSPSPLGTGLTVLPTSQINYAFPPPVQGSIPGLMDHPIPMPPTLGMFPGQQGLPPSQAPRWDEKRFGDRGERYPPGGRDHPRRDYHSGSSHPDFSSRSRREEEQYRMQLSPRSRRRFDADRQAREGRSQYRDSRYDNRRYDDYQARKRARELPRDASPRGSHSKYKRSRHSPTPEEGDATPVRDERPPPEEKKPVRKAGDVSKVGKKPRRDKKSNSVDRSKRKFSKSPEKESKSLRSSKADSSSKSVKRKAESHDDESKTIPELSKSKKSEKTENVKKRSRRDDTPTKTSKKEASRKTDPVKKSERKENGSKKENETQSENHKQENERKKEIETETGKSLGDVRPSDVVVNDNEADGHDVTEAMEAKDEETGSQIATEMSESSEKVEPSKVPALEEKVGAESTAEPDSAEEPTSKTRQPVSKTKTVATKTAAKEKKKEKSNKTVKLVRSKPNETVKKEQAGKITKAKKDDNSSIQDAEKTNAKSKEDVNDVKLVEYDGTGPPPVGDELVKITIPKSK